MTSICAWKPARAWRWWAHRVLAKPPSCACSLVWKCQALESCICSAAARTTCASISTFPPDVRLVSQNPALLGSLSVLHNVGFLLYRGGLLSDKEIKERVARCLEAVGLAGTEDLMPAELSGGMQSG